MPVFVFMPSTQRGLRKYLRRSKAALRRRVLNPDEADRKIEEEFGWLIRRLKLAGMSPADIEDLTAETSQKFQQQLS